MDLREEGEQCPLSDLAQHPVQNVRVWHAERRRDGDSCEAKGELQCASRGGCERPTWLPQGASQSRFRVLASFGKPVNIGVRDPLALARRALRVEHQVTPCGA